MRHMPALARAVYILGVDGLAADEILLNSVIAAAAEGRKWQLAGLPLHSTSAEDVTCLPAAGTERACRL